ncbi:MAG: hypothetical protein KDA20_03580 [Phycisphaerales bacterium]|nr:hypothetical protein [Phycisphaerales bacterium]
MSETDKRIVRWVARTVLIGLFTSGLTLAIRLATKPAPPPNRDYVAEYNAMLDQIGPYDQGVWNRIEGEAIVCEVYCESAAKEVFGDLGTADDINVFLLLFPEDYVFPDQNPPIDPRDELTLEATRLAYERLDDLDVGVSLDEPFRAPPMRPPLQSHVFSGNTEDVRALGFLLMARCDFALQRRDRAGTAQHLRRLTQSAHVSIQNCSGMDIISGVSMMRYAHVQTARTIASNCGINPSELLAALPHDLRMTQVMMRDSKASRLLLLDTFDRHFNGDPTGTIERYGLLTRLWASHGEYYKAINDKFDLVDQWVQLPPIERRKQSLRDLIAPVNTPNKFIDELIEIALCRPDLMDFADQRYKAIRLMLALEVHRERNDAYPEALTQLVPDILPELPDDPYATDGMFHYAREGDSYRLWSVAFDGVDDNGAPMESKRGNDPFSGKGDWLLFPPPPE